MADHSANKNLMSFSCDGNTFMGQLTGLVCVGMGRSSLVIFGDGAPAKDETLQRLTTLFHRRVDISIDI